VHPAQDPSHLPLLPQDVQERLPDLGMPRPFIGQEGEVGTDQRRQFRPRHRPLVLQDPEDADHPHRILPKHLGGFRRQFRPMENKAVRGPATRLPAGKKGPQPAGTPRLLLANPRGRRVADQMDRAEMPVGFPHQRLALAQDVGLRIPHRLGQLALEPQGQHIPGTALQDVQPFAQGHEESKGRFRLGGLVRTQPSLAHQLRQRRPLPGNPAHPAQVVKIPQPAHARFQVGFLHKHRAALFAMPAGLVFHPPGQIPLHPLRQVPPLELLEKFLPKRRRAADPPRVEERGLDHRLRLGAIHRLRHRAAGVPHLQPQIPEHVENLLHHLLRRLVGGAFADEDEIDVARRAHFLPTEAPHRPQHQPVPADGSARGLPQPLEGHGEQLGAAMGQLQSRGSRPRLFLQPVFLQPEKLAVHVEPGRGGSGRTQRLFRALQHGPQPRGTDRSFFQTRRGGTAHPVTPAVGPWPRSGSGNPRCWRTGRP